MLLVRFLTAWILRLPEILNTAGLLVVAFKDAHVKQSVIPILENRYERSMLMCEMTDLRLFGLQSTVTRVCGTVIP